MNSENNNTFNNINVGTNPQTPNMNPQPSQSMYQQPTAQYYQQPQVDPMAKVSNLNKEDAMEEALSHTNQYTPFEVPKQEILETPKKESAKSAGILFGIIIVIMALFIAFLPQISKLFGW